MSIAALLVIIVQANLIALLTVLRGDVQQVQSRGSAVYLLFVGLDQFGVQRKRSLLNGLLFSL